MIIKSLFYFKNGLRDFAGRPYLIRKSALDWEFLRELLHIKPPDPTRSRSASKQHTASVFFKNKLHNFAIIDATAFMDPAQYILWQSQLG